MPVANPYYNPDWEAIHDYHHKYRTRLRAESNIFEYPSGEFPFRYCSAEHDHEFHHRVCLHLLTWVQHKTVQDFAEWLIKNFSYELDLSTVPPYEEFTSMEEAMAFHKALRDEYDKKQEMQAEAKVSAPRSSSTYDEPTTDYDDLPNLAIGVRPSIWERITGIFH